MRKKNVILFIAALIFLFSHSICYAHEYDAYMDENLLTVEYYGIEYKIPESWNESKKIIDEFTYYYDGDMMIMITTEEYEKESFDILNETELTEIKNIFSGNLSSNESCGKIIDEIININERIGLKFTYDYTYDGVIYDSVMVAISYDYRIYEFGLIVPRGCSTDYSKAYDCLLDNIEYTPEEMLNETNRIGEFEKADYEKFNSYASDNGLGGTPIYIEGKMLFKIEEADFLAFLLTQDNGKQWIVSSWNNSETSQNTIDGFQDKNLRVFGLYVGYSDVFHAPSIRILDEAAYIEARGENGLYSTIWTYNDWVNSLSEEELQNSQYNAQDEPEDLTESNIEAQNEDVEHEETTWEEKLQADLNIFLSTEVANKAYDILVNQIGFTEIEYIGQNEIGGSNYDFDAKSYDFTMTASDDVYRIFQPSGGAVFYEDGAVKQTISELEDKVIDSGDQSAYYIMAKEIVESCLVNPRSADFPSITFSASDIKMQRKGDIVGVQSYVDSKNALGTVVRSQWLVEFQVIDLDSFSYDTLYVQIDGETSGEFIDLN